MSKASQRRRRQRERQQEVSSQNPNVDDLFEKDDFAAARDILLSKQSRSDDERRMLAKCLLFLDQEQEAADEIAKAKCVGAADYYLLGLHLRYAKRWEEAQIALRQSLRIKPDSPLTRLILAESLLKDSWRLTEDSNEARSLLLECCTPGQSIPDAFLKLNKLLNWESESSQIISLLQTGVEQHPENDELRICFARRLISDLQQHAVAEEILAPLLLESRPNPEIVWLAFEIDNALCRWDNALRWLDLFLDYKAAAHSTDWPTGLYLAKGEVLLELRRLNEATECFNQEAEQELLVNKVLSLAGLVEVAVLTSDIESAATTLRKMITIWCELSEVGELPGTNSTVYSYSFKHHFVTLQRLQTRLHSHPAPEVFAPSLEHFEYLFDRSKGRPLPLKRLRTVARSLKHHIVDYDFSMTYGEQLRYAEATVHFLSFSSAAYGIDPDTYEAWITKFFDKQIRPFSPRIPNSSAEIHRKVVAFLNSNERHKEEKFIRGFIWPFYREFWRRMLFDMEMWKEVKDVAAFLSNILPEETDSLFDVAYSLDALGDRHGSIKVYRELLSKNSENSAAWHNLSILIEADDCAESIECARKAFELAPNAEYSIRRWKGVQDLEQRKVAEESKRVQEQARKDAFLQTARERFPQLDYHKRRILSTLTIVPAFDGLEHLAALSGTGAPYIEGNWRKLIELGMIVEDEHGKPHVNKYVLDLVQQERSHSVATTLIRADDSIAFKPIFNSRLEYTIYNVMIGLFPNHLVFPNMSLQTIFQYDRMRDLVDADTFRYYLMSQVDICITSTANYLPIVAFEIDSHYHDAKPQQDRDEKKNTIFRVGGVSLLRLRAHGQPNEAAMRNDIVRAVRELGEVLRETSTKAEGMLKVELEIDFEKFGKASRE